MSCTEGYNKNLFLEQVGEMTAQLKGKTLYKLSYPSWEHGTRLTWLMRNANLADAPKDFRVDDLGTKIEIDLMLDEVVYI